MGLGLTIVKDNLYDRATDRSLWERSNRFAARVWLCSCCGGNRQSFSEDRLDSWPAYGFLSGCLGVSRLGRDPLHGVKTGQCLHFGRKLPAGISIYFLLPWTCLCCCVDLCVLWLYQIVLSLTLTSTLIFHCPVYVLDTIYGHVRVPCHFTSSPAYRRLLKWLLYLCCSSDF